MDQKVAFIRKVYLVYTVERNAEGTPWVAKDAANAHPSISKAKHWSRLQPAGTVRRYESLEREFGPKFMKELFK